jgi:hypothetical protein
VNTEPTNTTRTPVPRHFIAGMVCGFLAVVAILSAVAYYALVGAGALPEPPRGLSPIWAMVIVLPALVPIGLWCADVAARPIQQRIDKLEACLERASEDALKAANEAGYWRGIATSTRGDIENLPSSAEVIRLVREGRQNGNVG